MLIDHLAFNIDTFCLVQIFFFFFFLFVILILLCWQQVWEAVKSYLSCLRNTDIKVPILQINMLISPSSPLQPTVIYLRHFIFWFIVIAIRSCNLSVMLPGHKRKTLQPEILLRVLCALCRYIALLLNFINIV